MSNASYSAQIIHGEYYPHIDGVRALAVLPVVLFHVLASLCPGGFAGVDVFFVISGYLITGGILRDLAKDRFTIRNFYHRRIRRIMPAYFAMIAGVFAAGCVLYYATRLIFLGDAVVAGTLFAANFYFRVHSGNYFATPQLDSQTLLHLWSLSVEEQFYLFIPLLCAVLWKVRRLVRPVLALLAALSLSGAIYAVMRGKESAAFYLLHFRAWELLAGSLLATLRSPRPLVGEGQTDTGRLPSLHAILATLGLLMVLISYVVISTKTPFPGAAALPPVLGTVLLIRYGQSGWVSRLLSCRPFVFIGKMSYSLYLWHWPVTVFWKYAVYQQLFLLDYIGMALLSLLLGYVSWKFVELPVRISRSWTMRRSFVFTAAGIALLVALGTACEYYKGWPTTLHPKANEFAYINPARDPVVLSGVLAVIRPMRAITGHDFQVVAEHDRSMRLAKFSQGYNGSSAIGDSGQPQVFLLGDSHAGSLQYGLDRMLRENHRSGYATSVPFADMFNMQSAESQTALNKLAEMPHGSHVILAEMWARDRFDKQGVLQDPDTVYAQLEEFALHIKSMNKALIVTTDVPLYGHSPSDIAARVRIIAPRQMGVVWETQRQSETRYDDAQGKINCKLHEACRKTGAVLVSLHLAFKRGDHYITDVEQDAHLVQLYKDSDHLSQAGSHLVAQFIMPYLFSEAIGAQRLERPFPQSDRSADPQ